MKHPIGSIVGLTVSVSVSLVTTAFGSLVDIAYVPVGNPGNAADTRVGSGSLGFGAVNYAYNIGKYEVTNAQYCEFLKAKASTDTYALYNTGMAGRGIARTGSSGSYNYSLTSGLENRPVVFVSWFDAARFTNWLGNGQGSGDTETGAYTLIGGQLAGAVTVNPNAKVYIPSVNEWYKAAYYNGDTATYSLYPNGQDTITIAEANCGGSSGVNHSTDVGSYSGDPSFYGTFDQGGNVAEWTAAVYGSLHGQRGGDFSKPEQLLASSISSVPTPGESIYAGFRVASLTAVPEPASLFSTLTLVSSGLLLRRRTKALR